MTIAVILAVRGPDEAELARAIEAHPGLVVVRRCADLVEALAAAAAGLGGVVVLSDQPRLDRAVIRTMGRHGMSVIGIPSSPEAATRLLSLGVGTVTAVGATMDEVVAGIVESIEEVVVEDAPPVSEEAGRGTVVSVWGPTGAPGRTMLAVNLATELASISGSVILIDADAYGGAVAQALGLLDEAPGIAAVARAALEGGALPAAIRRFALEVRPGMRVLSGISQASRWPELPAAALEPMLAAVRSETAITVVDCGFGIEGEGPVGGAGRNDATLSALASSDLIIVVGSAEPLGIQRLVRALADLNDVAGTIPRLVVVNRVRASVCGARPAQAVGDVLARYAAVGEVWIIPDDPKACDAATLAGQALAERAPHSSARKAIEAIARRVWADLEASAIEGVANPARV